MENVENDPVDGYDDGIQGEWSVVVAILRPDGTAVVTSFMGSFEGIVNACNDEDEPGNWCKDLVGEDCVFGVGGSLAEGVRY